MTPLAPVYVVTFNGGFRDDDEEAAKEIVAVYVARKDAEQRVRYEVEKMHGRTWNYDIVESPFEPEDG